MTAPLPASYFQVEPSTQLTFNYIPRKYLNANLQLTNITELPIAFKIKTNAPKNYLVKPHSGTLLPRHTTRINITMQPTEYNPQTASISDKFLITAVPLPANADLDALSDQTHFTTMWDTLKIHLREHKLKVGLKFEGVSESTSLMEKANALESSRTSERESLTESGRDMLKEGRSSIVTTYHDPESKDSARPSSLMASFSSDMNTSLQASGMSGLNKGGESQRLSNQSQGGRTEEKRVSFQGDNKVETVGTTPIVGDTEDSMRKRLEELVVERKKMDQKCQDLLTKSEEQKRMLLALSEENNRLKSELGNLKSSTFAEKAVKKDVGELGGYQSWHLLAVAIVAMIFGALLGPR